MINPHIFLKGLKVRCANVSILSRGKYQGSSRRDNQSFSETCGNKNFEKLTDKYMNNLNSIPSRGGVEWGLTGVLSGHVKRVAVGTSLSS